jgi:hypothetical protein
VACCARHLSFRHLHTVTQWFVQLGRSVTTEFLFPWKKWTIRVWDMQHTAANIVSTLVSWTTYTKHAPVTVCFKIYLAQFTRFNHYWRQMFGATRLPAKLTQTPQRSSGRNSRTPCFAILQIANKLRGKLRSTLLPEVEGILVKDQ